MNGGSGCKYSGKKYIIKTEDIYMYIVPILGFIYRYYTKLQIPRLKFNKDQEWAQMPC